MAAGVTSTRSLLCTGLHPIWLSGRQSSPSVHSFFHPSINHSVGTFLKPASVSCWEHPYAFISAVLFTWQSIPRAGWIIVIETTIQRGEAKTQRGEVTCQGARGWAGAEASAWLSPPVSALGSCAFLFYACLTRSRKHSHFMILATFILWLQSFCRWQQPA